MRLYQVDAFTNESFKGNPAAVCLMDTPQADTWMQAFASEMNLSETAFLQPNDDYYGVRVANNISTVGGGEFSCYGARGGDPSSFVELC